MEFHAFGETTSLDNPSREIIASRFCDVMREYIGNAKNLCIVPPDYTRYESQAGFLTETLWRAFSKQIGGILPALGTHHPMITREKREMFGTVPESVFMTHNWREDVETLGSVEASYIENLSEGRLSFDWPVQLNKHLVDGTFDRIISIGQVVPHEVTGMANYTKNLLIGTGGKEAIDKSHYLGAVYGLERILGRLRSPVRQLLNHAFKEHAADLPVVYVLTVIDPFGPRDEKLKGIFIGDSETCFTKAAELSKKVNVHLLNRPLNTAIVYLDPKKYGNLWIGNKGIYRLRMAMAEGGTLYLYAPGIQGCREDPAIDLLIRKYGYAGKNNIMEMVETEKELAENLSAAAHLIHGSSEGVFTIYLCTDAMPKEEVEALHFSHISLQEMHTRFPVNRLAHGYNTADRGEQVFFIADPALGLWAQKTTFSEESGV